MTIGDLNIGAMIQRLGEQIVITDKQTTVIGVRRILEFRAKRGNSQSAAIWYSGAIVQSWLDSAQMIDNPESEEEESE